MAPTNRKCHPNVLINEGITVLPRQRYSTGTFDEHIGIQRTAVTERACHACQLRSVEVAQVKALQTAACRESVIHGGQIREGVTTEVDIFQLRTSGEGGIKFLYIVRNALDAGVFDELPLVSDELGNGRNNYGRMLLGFHFF